MNITFSKLNEFLGNEKIPYQNDVMLSSFSTMKTGGLCRLMILPSKGNMIPKIIDILNNSNCNYHIIGNGSNILFPDDPGDDIYICTKLLKEYQVDLKDDHGYIRSSSGMMISKIAYEAANNSLTGLEFAQGIPGSVGGAVKMNASAYNGEMSFVVEQTEYYSNGEIKTIKNEEHQWGYRSSVFGKDDIIIAVKFKLNFGDKSEILKKMGEFSEKRSNSQPLNYPSCGSVFKRPEGYFAGKLIQDAGLKGYTIGGAQVSEKHAGFIINIGNAKSSDVYELIKYIQNVVFDKFGVRLEPEIKIMERIS